MPSFGAMDHSAWPGSSVFDGAHVARARVIALLAEAGVQAVERYLAFTETA